MDGTHSRDTGHDGYLCAILVSSHNLWLLKRWETKGRKAAEYGVCRVGQVAGEDVDKATKGRPLYVVTGNGVSSERD